MKSLFIYSNYILIEYEFKYFKWIKKMFYVYWVVVIIYFVVQIGCFLFLDYDCIFEDFIIYVLIWLIVLGVVFILIVSWID